MKKTKSTAWTKEEEKLRDDLIGIMKGYLDTNVTTPTVETLNSDIFVIHKLGTLLLSLRMATELINEQGLTFDKSFLQQLPMEEIEKRIVILEKFINSKADEEQKIHAKAEQLLMLDSSKKHLLAYLSRELNWITISILSASYISALVLLRSAFELLIGIATRINGPIAERIESIRFLSVEEQKEIKKLWRKLCGWGHPYQKWEKGICPVFIAHTPVYHPKLCKECIEQFETILGLFLTVALDKFEINRADLRKRADEFNIDLSVIPFLKNRV